EPSMSMAHMAHTVFNAVTGVSLQDEMTERRGFRPMSEWRELLAEYDLGNAVEGADVPMIRNGDPSRNRMVSFVKNKPALSLAPVGIEASNDKHDDEETPAPEIG